MSRQSRVLLVMAVIAVGGLAVLTYMAQRYGKLLEEASTAPSPPARWSTDVDAFIRVRQAMRRAIDAAPDGAPSAEAVRAARDDALSDSVLGSDDYLRIREQYRRWREGRLAREAPAASAFEQRRERLRGVDLGGYEPLDS